MHYERPVIFDLGSIVEHTFTRCSDSTGDGDAPPKDWENFPLDKFGECSSGHALS